MLAPLFAGYLILGRSKGGTDAAGITLTAAERYADAQSVILPYVLVAVVLVVLAIVIARFPLPAIGKATQRASGAERSGLSLFKHRNLVFGVPAIFIYLIAEIGVANLFINFASQPDIAGITREQASRYLAILWGGMMVGRFAGSFLMRSIAAERVLAAFSIAAFLVMIVTTFTHGPAAMWALIVVGLCHSIMFPTIFSLGIRGLGPLTEEGSGLLIMAIAGGALVVAQGWLADRYGLQWSFLLTAVCELYVLFYALWGAVATQAQPDPQPVP
jgi:FHS family L-fucose permease-like MFS transporter